MSGSLAGSSSKLYSLASDDGHGKVCGKVSFQVAKTLLYKKDIRYILGSKRLWNASRYIECSSHHLQLAAQDMPLL